MSGGAYDYVYAHVQDMADSLQIKGSVLRMAFKKHLYLVSEAMQSIEWVDSGDFVDGDEMAAIRACLVPGAELSSAVDEARTALRNLETTLEVAGEPVEQNDYVKVLQPAISEMFRNKGFQEEDEYAWMTTPHALLQDKTPLSYVEAGDFMPVLNLVNILEAKDGGKS